jgi:hypothetical protein
MKKPDIDAELEAITERVPVHRGGRRKSYASQMIEEKNRENAELRRLIQKLIGDGTIKPDALREVAIPASTTPKPIPEVQRDATADAEKAHSEQKYEHEQRMKDIARHVAESRKISALAHAIEVESERRQRKARVLPLL